MALPSDAHVELVVCDTVRQTPEGKLDITGYFPVPEVKLDPNVRPPLAADLSFVFVVKDGDGPFRPRIRLLDPLGKELHHYDFPEFSKLADRAHLLILQINRIPVVNSGNFTIVLELNGQPYPRIVRIFQ
jgi:hypothetical protein